MIEKFKSELNQRKGKRDALQSELTSKQIESQDLTELLLDLEECQMIAQAVAKASQDKLSMKINEIVTTGMATVFDEPYEFFLDIESKGSDIKATPYFIKDGERISPKVQSGGGVQQVAAMSLRIALWSISKQRTPIMILDEVFKDVGAGDIERACLLLKTISVKLGMQIIAVTHSKEIKSVADKVFSVEKIDNVSHVTIVKEEGELQIENL